MWNHENMSVELIPVSKEKWLKKIQNIGGDSKTKSCKIFRESARIIGRRRYIGSLEILIRIPVETHQSHYKTYCVNDR